MKFRIGDRFKKNEQSGEIVAAFDSGYYLIAWDFMVGVYFIPTNVIDTYDKEEKCKYGTENNSNINGSSFYSRLPASEQENGENQIRKPKSIA